MNEQVAFENDTSGEWITPHVSYIEPLRNACAFCGRPIARRYWQTTKHGPQLKFCNAAHAQLYESYTLEIHGDCATSESAAH